MLISQVLEGFSVTRSQKTWAEKNPEAIVWIVFFGFVLLCIITYAIVSYLNREFTVTLSDTGETFTVRRNGYFYPPMREKDGKSFCGWYTDCSGRNIWDGNCKVTHDMTLYPFFVDRFV